MTQTIKLDWENCFGIKRLTCQFDFSENNHCQLVYAPNGTMKTSFAETMRYISGQSKLPPSDRLHDDRPSTHRLMINDKLITESCDKIFVVNGDEEIDASKSFVNFLASQDLKSKYDIIYNSLNLKKDALMSRLATLSKSSDCEKEIVQTFTQSNSDTIFSILGGLHTQVKVGAPQYSFKYNDIFDSKGSVKDFIDNFKDSLNDYITHYKELLNKSDFYRTRGEFTFGTFQADKLLKNVSDGSFFGVQHKMVLQNEQEIKSPDDLKSIIEEERNRILGDSKLKKLFDKITTAIDKNTELREFKRVLEEHPDWIPEIINYEQFRKKVWVGFLSDEDIKPLFDEYIGVYNNNEKDLRDVLTQASQERKEWERIITLYNARFHVPIRVAMENQREIILKHEAAKLVFSYEEYGEDPVVKDKDNLYKILSRGEKRAFIILQFLFEMEARKKRNEDTIVVMDDIADSFDYQNKYAIIEYIKDLSECDNIYILILTHNYDFYRTVSSRLGISHNALWMVDRRRDNIVTLHRGQYKGDVFASVLVGHDDEDKKFISMIPFVRNLIEYTKGSSSEDYITLTECLHHKQNTRKITQEQVISILKEYTQGKGISRTAGEKKLYDLIIDTADKIMEEDTPNPIHIENKIVLSIAIRHLAENYMHDKVIEAGVRESALEVNGNQTGKWTGIYKKSCPNDNNAIIIERVNMMTPEVIHLNSFMFEPLIDMSVSHLIDLYNDCKGHLKVV